MAGVGWVGWWGGLGRFLMVPSICSPAIGRKPSSVRMCFAHPLHYDPFPELWGEPEEEEEEEEEEEMEQERKRPRLQALTKKSGTTSRAGTPRANADPLDQVRSIWKRD